MKQIGPHVNIVNLQVAKLIDLFHAY